MIIRLFNNQINNIFVLKVFKDDAFSIKLLNIIKHFRILFNTFVYY